MILYQNDKKQNEKMINSITSDIEKKSCEKECEDIGKTWVRKCPKCNSIIKYSSRHLYLRAIRLKCGCKKCSHLNHRLSQSLFIKKSTEIHGNKYDYSKTIYTKNVNKISIKCPFHGIFQQVAGYHLAGNGCPKCSHSFPSTAEKFIEKSNIIHNKKYDYSNVIYKGNKTKVCIICPIHGEFLQTPNCHLSGRGCYKCNTKYCLSKSEFYNTARKIHKFYYDYDLDSLSNHMNGHNSIIIICPIHGKFKQRLSHHLKGCGCSKCHYEKLHKLFKYSYEQFIDKANKIHNNFYNYSLVNYKNGRTKIKILCPLHGEFSQTPNTHLCNHGCPKCCHFVSKAETKFLDYLNVSYRGIKLKGWERKSVDGYDPNTNTVYEFLGDYWHGNPSIKKFSFKKIHPVTKLTYGKMYNRTFKTLNKIKSLGYNVKYIWEKDWYDFIKNKTQILNLQTL